MSPRTRKIASRLLTLAVTAAILIWAWRGMEYEPGQLGRAFGNATSAIRDMFPPDWSVLGRAIEKLLETLRMSIIGTAIGLVLALPISFLGARTSAIPRIFSSAVKTCLNVLRAIPAFVYAIIFVSMFGLGPFTGALAVGVSAFVMLAKLFAETLEGVHQAPIEAVKAVGGSPLQVFAYGMMPQALPQYVSQTLYAWEVSISTATITGIVGAGGIGMELRTIIGYGEWQKVTVYTLVLVVTVLLADMTSYFIRKRYV
jgi:phosphonate transport system permease protein